MENTAKGIRRPMSRLGGVLLSLGSGAAALWHASVDRRGGVGRSEALEFGKLPPHQGFGLWDRHRHPPAEDQIVSIPPERQPSERREAMPLFEFTGVRKLDSESYRLPCWRPRIANALDLVP